MLFWLTLVHSWCSVVTSVTFSSNLSNFFLSKKSSKTSQEISKSPNYPNISKIRKSKNPKKSPKKCHKIKKIIKKKTDNFKKFQKSEDLKKILNPQKSPFLNLNILKKKKICQKKSYSLSFPIVGGPIRPELSSPSCFRTQGGSPERDGLAGGIVAGRYFPILI